jgi:hypothetical protein
MASPQPPDFSDLLERLTGALDARRIPFMLIGARPFCCTAGRDSPKTSMSRSASRRTSHCWAQRIPIGSVQVPFATAEDLIIHKLFAGRALDLEDAASVVTRKGDGLDWA